MKKIYLTFLVVSLLGVGCNKTYPSRTFEREPNYVKNDVVAIIDYDCSDFKTQEEAQEFFKKSGGPKKDYYHFDANGDGQACDSYKYGAAPDKKCLEESIQWSNNHLKEIGYTEQPDGSWQDSDGNFPTSEEDNLNETEMNDVYNNCLGN